VVTSTNPAQKKMYNGKELQDELNLNWYDYGARNYDAALGRFMNVDKFAERFENLSPYQYANNTPTYFIDRNGEYISLYLNKGKKNEQALRYNNKENKFYYHGGDNDGKAYEGENKFVASVNDALISIESGGKAGKALVGFLADNKRKTVEIAKTRKGVGNFARSSGRAIGFNPDSKNGGLDANGGNSRPTFIGLAHEMAHVEDTWNGTQDNTFWFNYKNGKGETKTKSYREVYASYRENQVRRENGLPLRAYYSTNASSRTKISSNTVFRMLKNLTAKLIQVQPSKPQIQLLKPSKN